MRVFVRRGRGRGRRRPHFALGMKDTSEDWERIGCVYMSAVLSLLFLLFCLLCKLLILK